MVVASRGTACLGSPPPLLFANRVVRIVALVILDKPYEKFAFEPGNLSRLHCLTACVAQGCLIFGA